MKFHSIGVIAKQNTAGVKETLATLVRFLQQKKTSIFLESGTAEILATQIPLPRVTYDEMGSRCDLVVIVGGDGSLLSAVRQLSGKSLSFVGINRGNFGFLTDIKPPEFEEKLGAILEGSYHEEKRFMLEAFCVNGRAKSVPQTAFNEVVLTLSQPTRMLDLEIYIDGVFMCSQRSDGLIAATPTGSTAYALSAGGPILHPALNAIVMIPMFPHTLTHRPIVIDADRVVTIRLPEKVNEFPRVVCDGQTAFDVNPGEEICIQKAKQSVCLVHPLDYDYFEALRSKLHWGKKLTDGGSVEIRQGKGMRIED